MNSSSGATSGAEANERTLTGKASAHADDDSPRTYRWPIEINQRSVLVGFIFRRPRVGCIYVPGLPNVSRLPEVNGTRRALLKNASASPSSWHSVAGASKPDAATNCRFAFPSHARGIRADSARHENSIDARNCRSLDIISTRHLRERGKRTAARSGRGVESARISKRRLR